MWKDWSFEESGQYSTLAPNIYLNINPFGTFEDKYPVSNSVQNQINPINILQKLQIVLTFPMVLQDSN